MSTSDLEMARLMELAVESLLGTLSSEESQELAQLRDRNPHFDVFSLERSAAALQLAVMTSLDPLPERLRIRLASDAADFFGPAIRERRSDPARPPESSTPLAGRSARWGWYAAAASLVLALVLWVERPSPVNVATLPTPINPHPAPVPAPDGPSVAPPVQVAAQRTARISEQSAPSGEPGDPAVARDRLLASSRYVIRRSWRPGNDPAGSRVSGDLVWDPKSQRGFMSFAGLRRNNPNVEQYQLWIFDARRDERYPIDGGVFDITDDRGAEVVAIKAALKVGVPLMFAVTIERPAGWWYRIVPASRRLPTSADIFRAGESKHRPLANCLTSHTFELRRVVPNQSG